MRQEAWGEVREGHKKRTEWFLTLLDFEVDIAQGPDIVGGAFGGTIIGFTDLEVWVLVAQDARLPPAVDIMAEGLGGDQTETVLFAYVFKFNCCCHSSYSLSA